MPASARLPPLVLMTHAVDGGGSGNHLRALVPGQSRESASIVMRRAAPPVPLVLLVDGDADSRDMYRLALSRAGFDVDTARDAKDAALKLAQRVPAVIALELRLPGDVSGYDLCRRVRSRAETFAVRLVAVTAQAFVSDADKARAAGCDAVLSKPCAPARLVTEVRRLLRPAPVARREAAHA